jgi:hypothetical protein
LGENFKENHQVGVDPSIRCATQDERVFVKILRKPVRPEQAAGRVEWVTTTGKT